MNDKVALIFTHKGSSDYLWYCLEQAKISCPDCRIILLGDNANKTDNPNIEHYLISDFMQSADDFEKVYRHQSSNPYWYELICFQRWFIIRDFVEKNNISRFYGCDTDIMIYDDLTKYIPDTKYRLTIANRNGPQCSYFTKETINEFCNYIIKQYTDSDSSQRLLTRYRGFIDNKRPGGNCDMTMFELYEKDYPGTVLDLGFEKLNPETNVLYCCSATTEWMQSETIKGFNIAKIRLIDKKPYIFAKDGNKYFCPVIHFLGQYKQFMPDYSTITPDKIEDIKQKYSEKQRFKMLKYIIKQCLPYGIVNWIKDHK